MAQNCAGVGESRGTGGSGFWGSIQASLSCEIEPLREERDLYSRHSLAPITQALELFADADDGIDRRLEFAADLGERVFDRWG